MLPDRVSNPGPLTYKSDPLPIVLRGPARKEKRKYVIRPDNETSYSDTSEWKSFGAYLVKHYLHVSIWYTPDRRSVSVSQGVIVLRETQACFIQLNTFIYVNLR